MSFSPDAASTTLNFTMQTRCRICGVQLPPSFFNLGAQPLANALAATRDEALNAPRYPLELARCINPECSLVQLTAVVSPAILFSEYLYTPSQSASFRRHFFELAEGLVRRFGLAGKLAVDIGSNDGLFLSYLRAAGALPWGVEPAANLAKQARQAGIMTSDLFFTEDWAETFVRNYQKASLVTASNVFAHVADLHDFCRGIRALLAPDGVFVIEVPGLLEMLRDGSFDLCLTPDEKVITNVGAKAISQAAVGDMVLTGKGRFRPVTHVFQRPYSGDIIHIRGYGYSKGMRLTPEHPVFVETEREDGRGWEQRQLRAGDVQCGDHLLVPVIQETLGAPILVIDSPHSGRGGKRVITDFPVGEDLARICGYYLAEGCYSVTGRKVGKASAAVQIAFGKSDAEKQLAEDCLTRIHRIGSSASLRLSEYGWHVYTSGPLARLLHQEFGTGSEKVSLPPWVYTLPLPLLRELFEGYMEGDGYHYRKGHYRRGVTVSEQLAHGMAAVGRRLGYTVSINQAAVRPGGFTIAGNPRPTESPKPTWDILAREQTVRRIKTWNDGQFQHSTVASVEVEHYEGDVFNLEVAEDNTYVTPAGLVHNCYHEHLSYFAVQPLLNLFRQHHLTLFDLEEIPIHGGSLRLYVSHDSWPGGDRSGRTRVANRISKELTGITSRSLSDLAHLASSTRRDLTAAIRSAGIPVIGYGAPAKATVLTAACGITAADVDYIVDDNPLKAGRWLPGAGIPILGRAPVSSVPAAACVIFPWNIAGDLLPKARAIAKAAIVPLPHLEVIRFDEERAESGSGREPGGGAGSSGRDAAGDGDATAPGRAAAGNAAAQEGDGGQDQAQEGRRETPGGREAQGGSGRQGSSKEDQQEQRQEPSGPKVLDSQVAPRPWEREGR